MKTLDTTFTDLGQKEIAEASGNRAMLNYANDTATDEGFLFDRLLVIRELSLLTNTSLPSPILRKGFLGNAVRTLQNVLHQLSYPCGRVDGLFGPTTERAIKQLQRDARLSEDGVYGEKTREYIENRLPKLAP